ncbi:MerR family transcriptional regulator [Streptomyces sp. NPDC048650]|uniref:MerR family transcriptional regulator n=1 Tax=unclassified Streptomyces TaxID=2593676 RepID=UPI003711DD15
MRIGELARLTGTSPRALRNYEREGLIGSERTANGYRDYDARASVRVRNIRHLLDAGLTLADVRCFTHCLDGDMTTVEPSPEGLRIARERLAVIDARIAAQTAARDRLARALLALPEDHSSVNCVGPAG